MSIEVITVCDVRLPVFPPGFGPSRGLCLRIGGRYLYCAAAGSRRRKPGFDPYFRPDGAISAGRHSAFIFMACILEKSPASSKTSTRWSTNGWAGSKAAWPRRPSLACTMLAAMVGVIGASEVTMGVIALPQMLKRKYDKFIACGSILAGGTLGILIPPSVMLIIYGLVDNSSIGSSTPGPSCRD